MNNQDVELVREIMADQEAMKTERTAFEAQWNEVIEIMLPRYRRFGQGYEQPGQKNTSKIFDATPALAHRHMSAAMDSMITPRTQKYQRLVASDPATKQSDAVKAYLEQTGDIQFSMRYKWRAQFASAINEVYGNQVAFGAGGVMVEDTGDRRNPLRYRQIRLADLFYTEGESGLVDKAHMRWCLTVRQAAQRWGRAALPPSMQLQLDRNPEQKYTFLHAVRPRRERDPRKVDGRNMAFQSVWILEQGNEIIEHGGFRTFPVAIGRLAVADGSQYAYGPAMDALPDIKMLNDMERTNIRAAQKVVDPPLLLPEDGALEGFDLRSGALNYGGISDRGDQMVRPLELGKNVPLGVDYAQQKRESINLAFYVTLFQIMVENPQMTATEVLQRQQEKGFLLAPTMGRVQSEMLGSMTTRELDILGSYAGLLPDMPQEIYQAEGEVDIEYDSPLNRAMRTEEGTAVLRWMEASAPFFSLDPRAAKVVNAVESVRGLADTFGVPTRFVNPDDVTKQQIAAEEEQAQAAAMLEAAPIAAGAAKDLSQAQATAQSAQL